MSTDGYLFILAWGFFGVAIVVKWLWKYLVQDGRDEKRAEDYVKWVMSGKGGLKRIRTDEKPPR